MDKKEISMIKKGLKIDNNGILEVVRLSHTYCKMTKEGLKMLFSSEGDFSCKDDDVKESYYVNIKKMLSGTLNKKLFNLNFNKNNGVESQKFLYSILKKDTFEEKSKELAEKIIDNVLYGTDIIITTMLCSVYMPRKKDDEDDGEYYNFIVCTVNQLHKTDAGLTVDISAKDVVEQSSSILINMNKPMEGFIYPNLFGNTPNANSVFYSAPKSDILNQLMVEDVLGLEMVLTAKEEKDMFSNLLKEALGNKSDYSTIRNIYNNIISERDINNKNSFNSEDIIEVLESSNVKNAEDVVLKYLPNKNIDIKVDNLIPTNKKGVKIKGNNFDVSINCTDIAKINKTVNNGKQVLIIELNSDISLDGIDVK